MPASKTSKKKKQKSSALVQQFRLTNKLLAIIIILFVVIGGFTLLRSLAATPLYTGAYEGAINPNGVTRFAQTYLNRKKGTPADYALDFLPGDSWTSIEGPSWSLSPWASSAYKTKMVFGLPMLPTPANGTSLAQGASGSYNSHFKTLAQNLVNAGMSNATLRLGWEFNGNWYTWSAANGQAANFKNYWIQIVNTMRGVSGANFKFDWNPTNGTGSLVHPEDAYPGDGYVDYIGDDVYNGSWVANYQDPTVRWNDINFSERGLQYWVTFAQSHNKPISFPEWGTGDRPDGHGGGDDAAFIQNMYGVMSGTTTAFDIYWDYHASDYNSALDEHPKAAAAFKQYFSGSSSTPTLPAATVTLKASPISITSGSSSTLTWSSTNATSCTASGGWGGAQATSGSLSVKPTATTTYSLSCSGSGGSGNASAAVTVTPPPPAASPAPTVKLSANPTSLVAGSSSTLTWSSTNATSCTASGGWGGAQATSGSSTVSPNATASYTLLCNGAGGQTSATTTITVTKPVTPPPTAPTAPATVSLVISPTPSGSAKQVSGTIQLSIPKANQTNFSKVQYYADGSLKKTITKGSVTYKFDTNSLKNGTHNLSVQVTYKNSSTTSAGTTQVTVSNKTSWFNNTWNAIKYGRRH